MSRQCERRGSEGYWADVDKSACVRDSLHAVDRIFQEFRSGYSLPGSGVDQERIVIKIFTLLSKEASVSEPPTRAEYSLILGLVENCSRYLRDMDFSLDNFLNSGGTVPHHYWKRQILGVVDEFYSVMRYLAKGEGESDGKMHLLHLLVDMGVLLAANLGMGESQSHIYCPVFTLSARIQLEPRTESLLQNLEKRPEYEDNACSSVLRASKVWINFLESESTIQQRDLIEVFEVVVTSIGGHHLAPHVPRLPEVDWQLVSPILTVVVEKEVEGGGSERLRDLDPHSLALTLQLPLLVEANLSLGRLHCASLDSYLHRPLLQPSPNCELNLVQKRVATCNCSVTGTFGLLLSINEGGMEARVDGWQSPTLVYGATTGLVLALLTLAALLKSHFLLPRAPDSVLKILSCASLSIFFVLLLLLVDKVLPHQAEEMTKVVLLSSLLASLSSNLALLLHTASTIVYICRPVFVHHAIVLIAISVPVFHLIILSSTVILCSTTPIIQVLLHSILSLPLLLVIAPLAVVALQRLRLSTRIIVPNSPKNEEVLTKIASLHYGLLNVTLIVMINIFGALFNIHKEDPLYEVLLSLISATTGLSLLCSFVLQPGCISSSTWLWSSRLSSSSAEHSLAGPTNSLGGTSEGIQAAGERGRQVPSTCGLCNLGSGSSPLPGKCLLRDEREPMITVAGSDGPETLLEVIERVKPAIGGENEQSFPSSRRSTMTGSSITLITSRDTSDYVTQEFPTKSHSPPGDLVSSSSFTSGELLVGINPLPSSSSLPTRPISPESLFEICPKSGRHGTSSLPRRS